MQSIRSSTSLYSKSNQSGVPLGGRPKIRKEILTNLTHEAGLIRSNFKALYLHKAV